MRIEGQGNDVKKDILPDTFPYEVIFLPAETSVHNEALVMPQRGFRIYTSLNGQRLEGRPCYIYEKGTTLQYGEVLLNEGGRIAQLYSITRDITFYDSIDVIDTLQAELVNIPKVGTGRELVSEALEKARDIALGQYNSEKDAYKKLLDEAREKRADKQSELRRVGILKQPKTE